MSWRLIRIFDFFFLFNDCPIWIFFLLDDEKVRGMWRENDLLILFLQMRCLIIENSCVLLCFQVIKYESVIHEFDPYFNYRVTQVSWLGIPSHLQFIVIFSSFISLLLFLSIFWYLKLHTKMMRLTCWFQFLTKNGIYEFWNWFDDRTW